MTKLIKDFWLQIHTIVLKETLMDNKLENTLFQSIWEQMSRSLVKEFIVKKKQISSKTYYSWNGHSLKSRPQHP